MRLFRNVFTHAIWMLLFIPIISIAEGSSETHTISVGMARKLITAALRAQGLTKLPAFDLEYYDGKDPRFYFFEADWETPATSVAAGVGHYAVNRVTGDVWEIMGCERITFPATERLKATIRKWTDMSKEEYERVRNLSPCP